MPADDHTRTQSEAAGRGHGTALGTGTRTRNDPGDAAGSHGEEQVLPRRLGVWSATALNIANMVGI
ncbi:MAG: hypothetical protein ACKOFW_22705, partial [Planctomycetaceae bacterium]